MGGIKISLQPSAVPSRNTAPLGRRSIRSVAAAWRAFSSSIMLLFWFLLVRYAKSPMLFGQQPSRFRNHIKLMPLASYLEVH